jgi:hypothetical protein
MYLHGFPIAYFQERFWAKVNKTDDCWLWIAVKNNYGYGRFTMGGKKFLAHRLSLEMALGRELSSGLLACHSCRNRDCVNPAHLREGTPSENNADRIRDGTDDRGSKSKTSKLTEDQVLAIKADTRSQVVIANEYGVHQTTIGQIKLGRAWGHLTLPTTGAVLPPYPLRHIWENQVAPRESECLPAAPLPGHAADATTCAHSGCDQS